jgi:hypothetical protein
MFSFKKKEKQRNGTRADGHNGTARTQLKQSLEIIRDFLARQEQRGDLLGKELQELETHIDVLVAAYRAAHATLRPSEEETKLLEISRLRKKVEHLKDMRNRALESMNNFVVMEREIEVSLESEHVVSIADKLNPEALQDMVSEIDIHYKHSMAAYGPVLQPVASPVSQQLASLREDLLGAAGSECENRLLQEQNLTEDLSTSEHV